MQVYYEYRWYYAVLVFIFVLAFGYYYDTAPLFQKIKKLQQEKSTNKAELLKISDALQTANLIDNASAVLTNKVSYLALHEKIILLIKQSQLQVNEIIFKPPQTSLLNAQLVQVELQGGLQNCLLFLSQITRISFGILTDFSLVQKESVARLTVSIYLFKDYAFKSLGQLNLDQPAFCAAKAAYLYHATNNKANLN